MLVAVVVMVNRVLLVVRVVLEEAVLEAQVIRQMLLLDKLTLVAVAVELDQVKLVMVLRVDLESL